MPTSTAQHPLVWRGYVEPHSISDEGRKRDGVANRLAVTPEVELESPEAVAEWINRRSGEIAKGADDDGRRLNALMVDRSHVNRSIATKGGSVYATVHTSAGRVVDVCAEAVVMSDPSESCPAGPGGHNYAKVKGVWRCTRCGKQM